MIPDIDNAFSEMAKGAQDEAFTHGLRDLSVTLDKKRRVERCCKVIKTDNRAASFVI